MKTITIASFAIGTALICAACNGGSDDSASKTPDTSATATPPAAPATAPATPAATSSAGGATTYATLKPTLDEKCGKCHGQAAGLSVATYASLMKGGKDGPVIKPGDPDGSLLIQYLNGTKKPQMPMRSAPLSADQIKTISDWIKAGAKES